ncbi:Phenylalanine--tRNA ligase alpha subunit [secondary endosymbiont of Trabutina mannipara]|uniref:Phenylalanine--tRNA ligase alpha subunit n=1 Tax=secondary endosymbiont of Trabutina mannipara TaxID=1835721 RepID=A0A1C3L3Z6_9ENTR|nr:phenylalanine--tRNA ligase subunit alpha [secondary endosymbiont of Trabutina mannipara]SBT81996.1 Phenylalanine--tRNA ligase alpha subunit [secondary endosymbiont of Trabutina mannipara]
MPKIEDLVAQAKKEIEQSQDTTTLDSIRIKYLGKKGFFSQEINNLRNLAPEERPFVGAILNKVKQEFKKELNKRKIILEKLTFDIKLANDTLDISLPGRRMENGGLHPISDTIARIEYFFGTLGFSVVTGPEIEDTYHNFDALNIPSHHSARTNKDTFWLDNTRLLRTHTSGVQIRIMKLQKPPIRIISSGRVYRNDYDYTHTPMFHQIEGLIIDTNISFTNLKGTLHDFLCNFFSENIQIRFRPSYFPFTELSAEVDLMRKKGNWLEVMGCGMIHPNVLRNVGIDPDIYSGFAFGIGIERLTMIYYNITDLRAFFENDLRFLKQFK